MLDPVTIALSSIAGAIFFYVLITYDSRSRLLNTALVFVASVLDIYPVFFSPMVQKVNLIGAFHGLITLFSYLILICWAIVYKKKLYECFCYVWLVAYLSGYLAGAS